MRMMQKTMAVLFACACVQLPAATGAQAIAPAPGWEAIGASIPSHLVPGAQGEIRVYVYNTGDAPAATGSEAGTVAIALPEGVTAEGKVQGRFPGPELLSEVQYNLTGNALQPCQGTGTRLVTCKLEFEYTLPLTGGPADIGPGDGAVVLIPVRVASTPPAGGLVHVSAAGGGALSTAETSFALTFSSEPAGLGIEAFQMAATDVNGLPDQRAGSHPYQLQTRFAMNSTVPPNSSPGIGPKPAGGQERNIDVNLPPGIIGNPLAVPQCTREEFNLEVCPVSTQVGVDQFSLQNIFRWAAPIFNLVPPPGMPAEFGFTIYGQSVFLDAAPRTWSDDGITARTEDLPERSVIYNDAIIWGTPADESHDAMRFAAGCEPGRGCKDPLPAVPFLTMPTSCTGPLTATAQIQGTWENEEAWTPVASGTMPGMTGCEKLVHFEPSLAITPDTRYADTPAGLSVTVSFPQGTNPEGLATAGLRDTTVVLPEGIAINPGQATGLEACQPSQEGLGEGDDGPPSCPAESKVGTDEITTPLLVHPLKGNVYVLGSTPPHLQLLMTASGAGINLKLLGDVYLNEQTGQLTTTFAKTPDLPFTQFTLSFSGGAQAALATPTHCGTYESTADFTPWSSPFVADTLDTSLFSINAGPSGAPCPGSSLPFQPTMDAGATTDQAGGYTSFSMLLQRGDDQQRIRTLSFKTPEGLLGMISRVALCPDAQAAQGTCSAASQIGHTVVGAGPGPYPFFIPQSSAPPAPIYLTGPYKGAPFGLSIVVPLIAGPFDLGTEVIRAKIEVDPLTAQITVTTDPLPVTVKGIPDDLRLINALIDRPEFMFNPTNCDPMAFSGTATSVDGASAPLSSHFQMGSCRALTFKPNFTVSTSGKTSRANGASLTAKIVYPTGNLGANQASSQSNIGQVKVDLPKQLPSRLTTLQKACVVETFDANPAACPAASRVGMAKAITPVLPVPLEGPAYFVSHGGAKFPELIIVLQGYGVTVQLRSETFINKEGITSSTFRQIPDVPVGTFALTLPQGPDSALAANGNLCATGRTVLVTKRVKVRSKSHTKTVTRKVRKTVAGLVMPTAFTGQNGAVIHQNTPIEVTGCVKHKTKPKHKNNKKKSKKK